MGIYCLQAYQNKLSITKTAQKHKYNTKTTKIHINEKLTKQNEYDSNTKQQNYSIWTNIHHSGRCILPKFQSHTSHSVKVYYN